MAAVLKQGWLTKKGEMTSRNVTRFYTLDSDGVLHYSKKEQKEKDVVDATAPPTPRRSQTIAQLKEQGKAKEGQMGFISGFKEVSAESVGNKFAIMIQGQKKIHRLFCTTAEEQTGWIEALSKFVRDDSWYHNKNVAVVTGMFMAWGTGKFSGEGREIEFAKYVASDVALDATAAMQHTDMYKTYTGMAGFFQWIDNLAQIEFPDFDANHVAGTLVPVATVMTHMSYTPTVTDTGRAGSKLSDTVEWTFNEEGLVSGGKFFWGQPAALDALFVPSPNVQSTRAFITAWGEGKFVGDDKETEFKKYFTEDAVMDATAQMQNTDMYDEYDGMAGFFEWINNLLQIDFPDFTFEIRAKDDGNVITYHSYTPTVKATGKTAAAVINDVVEWHFNEAGMCTAAKFYWGNPTQLDELFKSDRINMPERTGNLFKRGTLNRAYKERKFVLWEGSLSYFTLGERGTKKGEIYIAPGWSIQAIRENFPNYDTKQPYQFELVPAGGNGRTYKLKASTREDMEGWIGDIQATLDFVSAQELAEAEKKAKQSNIEAAMGFFGAWGEGKFVGDEKESVFKKFFTEDVKTLAKADMTNTDMYRDYEGMAGFFEWIDNLMQIDFPDFTPSFSDGPNGSVISLMEYTPTVKATGKTGPKMQDTVEWTFNADGMCTSGKFNWGNPSGLDKLFKAEVVKSPSTVVKYQATSVQEAWDNHFDAFGAQDLKKILKDYTARSVIRLFNHTTGEKTEFVGLSGAMDCFNSLFKDLSDLSSLEAPVIDVEDNDQKQVFLIWSCKSSGYISAQDSFLFADDNTILRQNIAVTTGDVELAIEPETDTNVALLTEFATGFFNGKTAGSAHPDCLFNPPGAPPMPMEQFLGICAGAKTCAPDWVPLVHFVEKVDEETYTVGTQQKIGKIQADFPAMGPFPLIEFDKMDERCKTTEINFPVEVGTYKVKDGKVLSGSYTGAVRTVDGVDVSPFVDEVWNKKGDMSDVGFGALFAWINAKPLAADEAITGIDLVSMIFTGAVVGAPLIDWYEQYLSEDFTCCFGPMTIPRDAYIGVCKALVASCPDFVYTCAEEGPLTSNADGSVSWIAIVKGTHTGDPFSPIPNVPAVEAKANPVKFENDKEKIIASFTPDGKKLTKLTVELLPGGTGFSGPVGAYLQMGGKPEDLPAQ